ncbi:ABC transporter permease [Runella limosa]|uniref:ABC transporter permease n=1 Tax=Runella limosa TaxID=370978 RepID=UPI000407CDBF|nr:ABC transporter permease [Runella limosa]
MLQNYFKIGWRSLKKNKLYAIINVFGLSVGITFAMLMGSYVWGEWRVNAELKDLDRQYILKSKWKQPNMGIEITTIAPLAKALKENFPSLVEDYYHFDAVTSVVSKGDKNFREDLQLGDSTLLSMYGFPLLEGDPKTALSQPNSVVISQKTALKYFGKTNVVGQTLQIESFSGERRDFMVSGVLANIPYNSVTQFVSSEIPILLPLRSLAFFGRDGAMTSWDNVYVVNYLKLRTGANLPALKRAIAQLIATHSSKVIQENIEVIPTPLSTLYREENNGLVNKTIATLSLVAFFILLMAVVNFVNLSMGGSAARLKEIGVRKSLGSTKTQLMRQFLAESTLLALFSTVVSWGLYELLRPSFSEFLGKDLLPFTSAPLAFLSLGIGLGMLVGGLAGAYPAFVLSSLPSVESIKGKLKNVKENRLFKYSLMVGQFSVALFVFGAAVIITNQVNYFFEKELGYSKEAIVWASVPRDWSAKGVAKMETIRNEMARLPQVSEVSLSYEIPDGRTGFQSGVFKLGQDSTQATFMPVLQTDEHYAQTYQIPMASGIYFGQNPAVGAQVPLVINQSAAKKLGFTPESALGQQVRLVGFGQLFHIVGVTKDFHFQSMRDQVGALAFVHLKTLNNYRYFSFKLRPSTVAEGVAAVEHKWRELLPGAPFEYKFLDDMLQKLYQTEIRLKKAAHTATLLAIIIVLLGVIGMVSLSVTRRTKELGIRKVLGASPASLVGLFLKEFLVVAALATAVAFPLVFVSMKNWLQSYAYRVEMSWTAFAFVAGSFGIVIILLVSVQTIKASLSNPTHSIKVE